MDLQDDYSFDIGAMVGPGSSSQSVSIREYAILPGGELTNVKTEQRVFTLTGVIRGTSFEDLHSKRQTLVEELSNDTYPADQPVTLRYTGAAVNKQIQGYYEAGLEGDFDAEENCAWERLAIRFITADPFWYEIGESSVLLDTNDSATFRYVAGRLKSTGQWDDLGPPNAGGTYTSVSAIAEDGTYVYFGGVFTNFDNIANADRIVRYNKSTGSYSALGTGMNGGVNDLAIGPDGTLYAVGAFTTAGGGGANRVASWDGAAWSALGVGVDAQAYTVAVGLDGNVYVGGEFVNAGGAGANRIAYWTGAAWVALGTGFDDRCNAIAIGLDGTVYAGGNFDSAGGARSDYVSAWDGSSWSDLDQGTSDEVQALAVGPDGTLYVGGQFTTAGFGTTTVNYVARWNGTAWEAMAGGTGSTVYDLSVGPDNMLYAVGDFSTVGGGTVFVAEGIARWNGASWAHWDINLPGTPAVYVVLASQYVDAVINSNYDLFVGYNTTGTGYFAGEATATNDGTTPVYPKIVYNRSGGTTAILETLRNETTGKELLFEYIMLDGETLTIDLTPTNKSIISSQFGDRLDIVFANSDFGTWSLLPNDNSVTSFVDVTGAPTITAYMLYKDAYKSMD
jgi:hypothetical protein